jgi:hypothetical protein
MRSLDVLRTVPECQEPRQLERWLSYSVASTKEEGRESAQDSPSHHPALHTQNIREITLACSRAFNIYCKYRKVQGLLGTMRTSA